MPSPPKNPFAGLLCGTNALCMWQGWGPLLVYDWEMQNQAGLSTLHLGMAKLEWEPRLPDTPGQSGDVGSGIEKRGLLRQASLLSKPWFAWSMEWWKAVFGPCVPHFSVFFSACWESSTASFPLPSPSIRSKKKKHFQPRPGGAAGIPCRGSLQNA